MKKFLVTVVTVAGTLGLAHGQAGVGQFYNTRDPFVCKSKKEPAKGAPSPSQLKDYVRCGQEKVLGALGGVIYLMENVKVEAGKGRPYQNSDVNFPNIDPSELLYPIRGSYDSFSCHRPHEVGFPAGKNCNLTKEPDCTGICYKTTFGDWSCSMMDSAALSRGPERQPMPPPQ